jgi:transglutaminase-like putative cysteine protease
LTSTPALDRQSRTLSPAPITASRDDAPAETGDLRFGLDLAATLGLIAYSVTVGVGFSRVFFDWDFLRDLVLIAAAGHGSSYVMRRLRLPSVIAIPLLLLGLTWLVAWIYYPDTFSSVFPLSDTWNVVRADYRIVQDEFQSTTPPVVYAGGWAFLAGATTAATVWLSDTFAFRAQARGEALVPGAVLFVFIAALGVDENRAECSLAVIGAGFVALALLRLRLERRPRTVLGRARHPLLGVAPGVIGAAGLVMAGAWAVAPHLPGAEAEPLFDTHNGRGGVTEIVSPLVDIRSRIVNQAETEMFAMTATEPSYWRISALPRFDGNRWDVADNEVEGNGETLPARSSEAVENVQVLVITELDGPLVPVAPEPVSAAIRSEDGGMSYVADSSALIKTENDLDEGDTFEMTSGMPRFAAEALQGATSDDPPDAMFLALPDDLPPVIAQTAEQVTAGASTNFDRMVALQDWFRTAFTYDTDIPDGHDSSAIVNFLENRVGYCEQFSGTFAAMARTLGIPARVAVGFTQGEIGDDGAYHVLGRNAHAWPEVWFDGYGWVPFEPTPGRGMPGAEAYTGIEPDQDDGEQAENTTTTTTTLPPTTTTLAGQTPPPPWQTTTTLPPETTTTQPPLGLDHSFSRGFPWMYVAIGVVFLALLIALPELVRRWRRRRHGPITDPVHALLELWDRALRALGAMGFRGDPTQTPLEVSDRAATVFPGVAGPLHELAVVATAASFAPRDDVAQIAASGWNATDHNGPHDWCETIETVAEESLGLRNRVRRYFTVWH